LRETKPPAAETCAAKALDYVRAAAHHAPGYRGFYYHFLDMKTGRRHGNCEISTIDTTYVLAGALTAACYFNRDTEERTRDSHVG